MKNIQPHVLALITLLTTTFLHAQDNPFRFGIKAGLNLSNAQEHTSYLVGTKQAKPGFQLGLTTDYLFTKNIYLQSGLILTTKGTVHKGAETWIGGSNPPITYWKNTTNQVYLQVPLRIGYQQKLSAVTGIFANAGGYFAYGIAGKETLINRTVSTSGEIPDEKIVSETFGKDLKPLDRPDYGLGFGIGTSYKKFTLSVEYELGLLNIGELKDQDSFETRVYKNRNFSVTIGYII